MAQSSTPSTEAIPGEALGVISDSSFTQLINSAFKNYQSTLALSRSPLANSALIRPTLVKDDASPTAEERGHGLRLILQWATEQIAPRGIEHPIGTYRPFDDPLWIDPLWWRYNILRHRYIEPLHPDDFVDGGRYTETLIALTGIPTTDTFFDERNRAIRDVTQRLRQQLVDGKANEELERLAIDEAIRPIIEQEHSLRLMGIASIFTEVFPQSLLREIASRESFPNISRHLDHLIQLRMLLVGDNNTNCWISSALRNYIYQHHPQRNLQRWHIHAAMHYEQQSSLLNAAEHWRLAGKHNKAAKILLESAQELMNELHISELIYALVQFEQHHVTELQWRELQILLSELYQKRSQREDALEACRRALKITKNHVDQARIYRRMGKLYEKYNQRHAITYYQKAIDRMEDDSAEIPYVLKDRGWLYILNSEWKKADDDLTKAIELTPPENLELRADIFDGFAGLYRYQHQLDLALQYAQDALALREEMGNLPRIATSQHNLGLVYVAAADHTHSIAAYEEALETYKKLNDSENCVGMYLNIGSAYYKMGNIQKAIKSYSTGLGICQQLEFPLAEVQVRYNLAEAYARLGDKKRAELNWDKGYKICIQADFAGERAYFESLADEYNFLRVSKNESQDTAEQFDDRHFHIAELDTKDQPILTLAQSHRLTPKLLIDQLRVSKATATRKLTALVEQGLLEKHGKGRGTYYALPQSSASEVNTSSAKIDVQAATVHINPSEILQKLDDALSTLGEEYALKSIDLQTTDPQARLPLRLEATFDSLPDLINFFVLEQRLADILGLEIDLKPSI